jgi:hypothetical protein
MLEMSPSRSSQFVLENQYERVFFEFFFVEMLWKSQKTVQAAQIKQNKEQNMFLEWSYVTSKDQTSTTGGTHYSI